MAQRDVEKQPLLDPQTHETTAAINPTDPTHEPTLHELQENVRNAQRAYMRAWSRSTSGKWHRRIMLSVTALLTCFLLFSSIVITSEALTDETDYYDSPRVPLEAHIMSKCPDARDCLHDLVLPAMQNISHKVDFRLSYIGTVTRDDDGVVCKHGPGECLGNILELCAARLYPDPKLYLGFAMCMSREYAEIPSQELVQECALEHGIAFEKLNRCAVRENGELSVGMLRESFERSAEADVTRSCTVRVGGEEWCVRDGGEWKGCKNGTTAEDLVKSVEEAYAVRNGWDEWSA